MMRLWKSIAVNLLISTVYSLPSRPIAIVTGGSRGIGRGIAEALSEAGYDLLLTYNTDEDAAKEFSQSLIDGSDKNTSDTCGGKEAQGRDENVNAIRRVEYVGGDISLSSTRDKIFKRLDSMTKESGSGSLAVLVHNAGQYVGITSHNSDNLEPGQLAFGDGSLLGKDDRTNFDTMHYYQRLYGEAFVDLCERSLQRMRKIGETEEDGIRGGSIIGISSPGVTAHYYGANPGYSMPGSGKCLMEYSMRIYAVKAAELGVNVNVIVPGVTKTLAWNRLAKSRGMKDEVEMLKGLVESRVPVKKIIEPRDIGNAVRFLCSNSGRFVTGTVLPVDGGIHLK